MTLGEAKKRVLMLMDEYSVSGERLNDRDIGLKMIPYFDTAQKELANIKRILRTVRVSPQEGAAPRDGTREYPLPGDFARLFRVWRAGKVLPAPQIMGEVMLLPAEEEETLLVEYFARPADLNEDTADGYEFEIAEDAAACLPFFVAAQQLVGDFVVDHRLLLSLYDRMAAALHTLPDRATVRITRS